MNYIYRDNKEKKVVLVVENLDTITQADKIFEHEIGYNPAKNPYIGCECTDKKVL